MAQTIKLRRSATAGATPTTSQLELGEVAINTYDGKMYIKKSVGGTESIVELGSGLTPADAILEEYLYTATASQTAFSGNDDNSDFLSYTAGALQVFLNGILLDPETDYTATNGATITLTAAAALNDYLQIFAFKKKIGDSSITINSFTGNNSTTAYTLTLDPGDENNTRVFIDGVYQSKSNYTVSGTTLTFSSAPPSGTSIEVEIGNRAVSLDTASNLDLPDNVKLRLGTGQDLQLYHTGSASILQENGTGTFYIQGTDIVFTNSAGSERYADFTDNGAVRLYHDNSIKLATASTGVDVTGNIVVSGTVDGRDVASDGAAAVAALPRTGGAMTGAITTNSTFDGRDVATDGSKLDGIEAGATADQTQSEINALGITATGLSGTPAISVANITTTGELRGPASLVIDPAAVGDNTGTVVIKGNLQVDGATTTINSTTLTVDDLNLTLASGAANGTAANGAGITIDGASATLTYNSTLDQWTTNKGLQVAGRVEAETAFRAYDADNTTYRNVLRFDSGDVRLETGTSSSSVDLGIWAGGSKAIAVKAAGGVDIIGNLDVTGNAVIDTAAGQLDIEALGGSSVKVKSSGSLKLQGTGGAVDLINGTTEVLSTTSTGVSVTGLTSSGVMNMTTPAATTARLTLTETNGVTTILDARGSSGNVGTTTNHQLNLVINSVAKAYLTTGGDFGVANDIQLSTTNPRIDYDGGNSGALRFFSTSASAEKMRITSAGLVGILNQNPDTELHVTGSTTSSLGYRVGAADRWKIRGNSGNAQLAFEYSTSTTLSDSNIQVELDSTGGAVFGGRIATRTSGYSFEVKKAAVSIGDGGTNGVLNLNATSKAFIKRAGNEAIVIDSNQNVGIGIATPTHKLNAVGASGTAVVQSIRNPNTGWSQYALTRYGTEGADVRYMDFGYYRGSTEATRGLVVKSQANATLVTFLDSGNVGIGTTAPTSKLSIQSGISSSSTGVIDILQNTNGAQKQAASIGILVNNGGESTNAAGMFFQTASGGSLSERMRLTSSGGLELGYNGAARQQADSQAFSIITPASGGGQGIALKRLDSNNDQQLGEISWSNNTQDGQANIRVKTAGATNSTDMHFDVNNAGTLVTALSIDGSAGGNVGIGHQLPSAGLHIKKQGRNFSQHAFYDGYDSDTGLGGTSGSIVGSQAGERTHSLILESDSTAGEDVGASIAFRARSSSGGTLGDVTYGAIVGAKENSEVANPNGTYDEQSQGYLGFYTSAGYSFGPHYGTLNYERMRISSEGKVGIGTTSPLSPLDVQLHSGGGRRFLVNYDDSLITVKGSNASESPESLRIVTDTFRVYTGTSGSGTHRMTIANDGRIGFGEAAGNAGHQDIEGKMDLRMDMSGVNWTENDWASVWDSAGTPGSNFNKAVLHLDTNRFGGSTGGIVGIAFSPGWQGHQNWGIYSHNRSGGASSEGDLSFVNQINAGNIQERVRFKANGNVGIGTTAPSFEAPSGSNNQTGLHIQNGNNDSSTHLKLTGRNNTGTPGQATSFEIAHRGDSLKTSFYHGGTEVWNFDSLGHAHLGMNDADTRLTFGSVGTANTNSSNNIRAVSAGLMYNSGGAGSTHIWEVNGAQRLNLNTIGRLEVKSADTSDNYNLVATSTNTRDPGLLLVRDSTVGFGIAVRASTNDYADFQVNNSGAPSYGEEGKMRIYHNGNISIPGTALWSSAVGNLLFPTGSHYMVRTSTSTGNESMIISNTVGTGGQLGVLQYRNGGSIRGDYLIATNTAGIYFNSASDYRFKENVTTVEEDHLTKLTSLRPVTYTEREGWQSDVDTETVHTGFIAHEVEEIYPEFVEGEKDALWTQEELDARGDEIETEESVGDPKYQTVAYTKKEWNVYMIRALQQLKAENEALKARLDALEGE